MVKVERPQRRVATPQTPLATFKVDYSGIAKAGASIASGFGALAQVQEKNKAEAKQTERFNTLAAFNDWEAQTQMELEKFKQDTPIGTANYLEQADGLVEAARSRFMNDVPAELQPEFNMRTTNVKNSLVLGQMKFDLTQKDLFFTSKISDQLEGLKRSVYTDPGALDAARSNINELIDSSALPEAQKFEQRRLANSALASIGLAATAKHNRLQEHGMFTATGGSPVADLNLRPSMKAILNLIAKPESGGRYNVRHDGTPTGATFSDFSRHPNINEANNSTAAGRYQITKQTWDFFAPKVGVTDFSPESQDKVAAAIVDYTVKQETGSTVDALLAAGKGDEIRAALSKARWPGVRAYDANSWAAGLQEDGVKNINAPGVRFRFNGTTGTAAELGSRFDNFKKINPQVLNAVGAAFSSLGLDQIDINSGYRSPEHNERVGGAKKSQHMHGQAVDINVSQMNIEQRKNLIRALSAAGIQGLGVGANIIHADLGNKRAWGYKSSSGGGEVPSWAAGVINDHLNGRIAQNGNESLITDPRFADVPFDTALAALNKGRSDADAEYNAMVKQQQEREDAQRNQLYVGINDGLYGLPEINAARASGLLTDFEDIKKAQDILKARQKDGADLRNAQEYRDSGGPWIDGNPDHEKWANALWKNSGGQEAIANRDQGFVDDRLLPAYEKMGMASKLLASQLMAMTRANDQQSAAFALETLRAMRERNPGGFAAQFPNDLQDKLDLWTATEGNFKQEDRAVAVTGYGLDQAQRQAQEVRQKEAEKLYDDPNDPINGTQNVIDALDTVFTSAAEAPLAPSQSFALDKEYRAAFIVNYGKTGDEELAKELTTKQMTRSWRYSDIGGTRRLMKYPPDYAGYKAFKGSYDWIDKQVREDFGWDESVQFQLVPTEKTTSEIAGYKAWKSGVDQGVDGPPPPMPSYLVWYLKPDGTQGFARTAEGRGPEQINFGWTPKMEQQLVKEFEDRQQASQGEWAVNRYRELVDRQNEWDLQQSIGTSRGGAAPTEPRPVIPQDLLDAVQQNEQFQQQQILEGQRGRIESKRQGHEGTGQDATPPGRLNVNQRKKSRTGGR